MCNDSFPFKPEPGTSDELGQDIFGDEGGSDDDDVPDRFLCPIGHTVMVNPVQAADGGQEVGIHTHTPHNFYFVLFFTSS